MEDKNLAYIDDFIEIETYINNNTFETSGYTCLENFFSEHLNNSNINEKMKLEKTDVFRIEIGDKIAISPSTWTIKFREKHNLENDYSDYEMEYNVENIRIEYFTKNPQSDSELPKLQIRLYLNKSKV